MSRQIRNIYKPEDGRQKTRYTKSRELSYFCDGWLRSKSQQLRPSSYIKYNTTVERYIKPHLGGMLPQNVTAEAAERFSSELLHERGLAPKTVKDILMVLNSVLKYAAGQMPGKISVPELVYPKEERKAMRVLTPREQRKFTEYLLSGTDACKFGVLLALITGLRIGELCALRWESISIEDGTLSVERSMQRLKSAAPGGAKTSVQISAPKSCASVRTIPLTAFARSLCETMAVNDPYAYVLTGTRKYMEPRTLQYRLKKYTSACGLAGVHFHTLRHTFATRCVEVGFEIKSLSEVLGHSSTRVTLDRYVHPSMQLKRANMDKLAELGM